MKLVIPVMEEQKAYPEVELKRLRGSDFGSVTRAIQDSTIYNGILELLRVGISSFIDEDGNQTDEPQNITRLCRNMAWNSAEHISVEILARELEDRTISGLYECPMCGKNNRAVKDPNTGIDTRDSLDDLPIYYMPPGEPRNFHLEFRTPVTIKDRDGKVIMEVTDIDMRYPTMNDVISGALRNRDDEMRAQLSTYANAIIAYNGEQPSRGHVSILGENVINQLLTEDLMLIGAELRRYEMRKTLEKTCSCGNRWNAPANLQSFFASGLQRESANR